MKNAQIVEAELASHEEDFDTRICPKCGLVFGPAESDKLVKELALEFGFVVAEEGRGQCPACFKQIAGDLDPLAI